MNICFWSIFRTQDDGLLVAIDHPPALGVQVAGHLSVAFHGKTSCPTIRYENGHALPPHRRQGELLHFNLNLTVPILQTDFFLPF